MQTRNRNTFTTIHTEGALLPVDLLQRISENDKNLEGLNPESYHLAPGEKLNEAINRSWNRLSGLWGSFQAARGRLGSTDAGTTLTRERWLLPLFQELGFGRLSTSKAVDIEGKSYPISHRWHTANAAVPLHLVGCGIELDKRTPGAAGASRTSPHSLMQEYLNRSDDVQWGVISNGLGLRILRDNATLTRQAYIEFDLESMFDGEIYSDFVLLWLICHQSRFETTEKQTECLLEKWSKSAQESGTRALDDLRRGVEEAIVSFGQGFLQHPLNGELRYRLKNGDLSAQDYYRQLLRLVYRLIFLFAAEDRDLLLLPWAAVEAQQRFLNYYSTTRLRALAQRQRGSRHHDRYEALRLVMTLLGSDSGCPELAIPALGGFLFDARSTADLNDARLDNQALLSAVRSLAFITEGNTRRAVDYRNLGPEELGSVYESLLELHPLLNTDAGTFQLTSAAGNERKTTGSYYTPSSLIQVLLDSALDPAIEDRLKGKQDAAQQEQALLELKVCDPACGSGHFLIAAAHRIAGWLAEVRAGDNEPSPNETRRALRDVIRHCIYGVDLNPMAVELCKVNLWLESLEPGKPLSFLDAHIKCGNSLVGVGPKMTIEDLEVPDEAFNPVTGDHKPTAALLKKRNKQEREGQESLFVTVVKDNEQLDQLLVDRIRAMEIMPEDSAVEVQAKAEAYQKVNESVEFRKQKLIADLWTSAFFWKIEESKSTYDITAPTHGQLERLKIGGNVQPGLIDQIENLSVLEGFFHWPIEFPDIARLRGFNCILGNPPWEKVQAEEQAFFASRDMRVSLAVGANRKKIIEDLREQNPSLYSDFVHYKKSIEVIDTYIKLSKRFPFTGSGKMNTYAIFAEHSRDSLNHRGCAGIIVPTGIATDDTTKEFFDDLLEKKEIASLFDFENKEGIFQGIHRSYKFCLLTISTFLSHDAQFIFSATSTDHLRDKLRQFFLSRSEIALFSPNTHTVPIFRSRVDADLNKYIYTKSLVITDIKKGSNPWNVSIHRMVNPTDDSKLFSSKQELISVNGQLVGNHFKTDQSVFVPVYEAKMIHQFDHRFGTYENQTIEQAKQGRLSEFDEIGHSDPNNLPLPRYWMEKKFAEEWITQHTNRQWLFAFRDITSSMNVNTAIATIIPRTATVDPLRVIYFDENKYPCSLQSCFIGCFNSIIFDYLSRQKVCGTHLAIFILKQLPVLPPSIFSVKDIEYITPRILELVYTSYDLKPFAIDLNYQGDPFKWDGKRRFELKTELDTYYARLFGLNRKQLRYILDPADLTTQELEDILDPWEEIADPLNTQSYNDRILNSDFPGMTFKGLRDKEFKHFGEYRTRRLVLEAWDRLEGVEIGNPDGYSAQSATVPPIQETISVVQPRSESQPAVIQTQLPASAKPDSLVTPPAKVVKKIDPPADQPTLSDFGLYKCEACGKMVMGFEKANHEQEKHGGKSVQWKKVR